jgi:putative transposase
MPRANRYYTPGHIWHITHRCHKRDFLLKFEKDRKLWIKWLFEAKKRYKVSVLNYIVTSNHVHLLICDNTPARSIPIFMQLIQGRTAQEYNNRKRRNGAYWEDRYHATAIGTDEHLQHCMVYIHMNMVRAGMVDHPIKWEESGYYEIANPKQRYSIIDYKTLLDVLGFDSIGQLQRVQAELVQEALRRDIQKREPKWTENIAVGDEGFIEKIRLELNIKPTPGRVTQSEDSFTLAEGDFPYPYDDNIVSKISF